MSPPHPRLLHAILLIMFAVFLFSSMDTLAKYKQVRLGSRPAVQIGTRRKET